MDNRIGLSTLEQKRWQEHRLKPPTPPPSRRVESRFSEKDSRKGRQDFLTRFIEAKKARGVRQKILALSLRDQSSAGSRQTRDGLNSTRPMEREAKAMRCTSADYRQTRDGLNSTRALEREAKATRRTSAGSRQT